MTPPPIPLHLLKGDHPWLDGALVAGHWALVAARLLSVPVVLFLGGPWMLVPLAGLVAGWWWASRRRVRSCAAPLGEEAVFLLGCAGLLAWTQGSMAAVGAMTGGLLLGVLVWGGLLAAVVVLWGRGTHAIQMRRPWFRVLGDNPATVTLVMKVSVDGPLVVALDRCSDGPVNAVLYGPGLGAVVGASWEEIRADYESGTAEVVLEAPPGRYLLSVRHYRPWSEWRAPRVVA